MKRSLLGFALVLVSIVVASSALGAAPKIVLQKSDFAPAAGARILQSGAEGKSGFASYAYRTGSRPNEIASSVAVLSSVARAKALFRESKSDALSFPGQQRIKLPPYGDEQFADFGGAGSQLIVRKNRTVWALILQTSLTRGGQTHDLTKAEATAEYKTYAPKQQRRVRNG